MSIVDDVRTCESNAKTALVTSVPQLLPWVQGPRIRRRPGCWSNYRVAPAGHWNTVTIRNWTCEQYLVISTSTLIPNPQGHRRTDGYPCYLAGPTLEMQRPGVPKTPKGNSVVPVLPVPFCTRPIRMINAMIISHATQVGSAAGSPPSVASGSPHMISDGDCGCKVGVTWPQLLTQTSKLALLPASQILVNISKSE